MRVSQPLSTVLFLLTLFLLEIHSLALERLVIRLLTWSFPFRPKFLPFGESLFFQKGDGNLAKQADEFSWFLTPGAVSHIVFSDTERDLAASAH